MTSHFERWLGRHPAAVSVFVLLMISAVCGEERVGRYEDGGGRQMWYRLYLPDNYDPSVTYPLTAFLHGSVRTIVDPEAEVAGAPQGLASAVSSGPYESLLIVPQLERGDWRSFDNDRLIRETIDDVQSNFGTDPQRRYVTGFSYAGFGTFHMLEEFPDYFAAAAPIAGYWFPEDFNTADPYGDFANRVKDVPIWAFHGTGDSIVSADATRAVVDALRSVDANIRYSELPLGPHEIWNEIYDANDFPPTVVFRLEVNTTNQTFQIVADVDQGSSLGLHRYAIALTGVDSIRNLGPKSDFSPVTGTSLGFTEGRSADDVLPLTAHQHLDANNSSVVDGFGQTAGILPGAGTGSGEVQPDYDAPLLLAEGTYMDLETLDFFTEANSRNIRYPFAAMINEGSLFRSARFGVSYPELYHDGELIYSWGDNSDFYPWLFSQRLVPEPSSGLLAGSILLVLSIARGAKPNSARSSEPASRHDHSIATAGTAAADHNMSGQVGPP